MEDFQQLEFLGCLDALVPQLDDVHAAGKRRVHEVQKSPRSLRASVQRYRRAAVWAECGSWHIPP
jgi:hypothetical protein